MTTLSSLKWLEHFERSLRRDRPFDFRQPLLLPAEVRGPVLASLQVFQRGLTSTGLDLRTKVRETCDRDYALAMDLYVREKNAHAELLAQLLWAAGERPSKRNLPDFLFRRIRRSLDWAPEVMVLLCAEMATMPFFRVLASHLEQPLVQDVLESIIADQAWHLGFHIDHLRPELEARSAIERTVLQQAWVGVFGTTLSGLLVETHDVFEALGYRRLAYWTDAWNLFAQVQSGLSGSPHHSAILLRDPRLRFVV